MMDPMKLILGAVAATAAVCLFPAGASAWTPEDCAAVHWDHPDCVNVPRPQTTVCLNGVTQQVLADQPPEGSSPGECVVPPVETTPPPPVETPPVVSVPPAVEDVPPVDVPPVDTPNVVPEDTPKVTHKPGEVLGKEQTTPQHKVDTPVQQAAETNGAYLPFTGLPLLPVLVAGLALGLTGFAARRALRS